MQVQKAVVVSYQKTNNPKTAQLWLDTLPDLFSADFETAIKYTDETVKKAKELMLDETLSRRERVAYQAVAKATALGHPSHCTITHCSIAVSNKDAYVFIIDSQGMADVVLDFLIKTEKTQVWHNYGYDGKFIRYFTYTDAKNVEDTQIFAKTLLNHVDVFKANTGLKELMGSYYGDWGISASNFTVAQQHEEHVIKYSAVDACATFYLWEYLNDFVRDNQ
jgi:DNA polymerase I-like protein with 3'-5' exonuclease and polymerase domains